MGGEDCWGINIDITRELASKKVFLGQACFEAGNNVFLNYNIIWKNLLKKISEVVKEKTRLEELKNHPIIKAYRKFFWSHKMDPTKIRPAGEALARRLLKKGFFKSINPIVDAGNLASAATFVSIGLYDAEKIPVKKLSLTYSIGGEVFNPIGGHSIVLEKSLPILKSGGLIMHIYPHRDCRETMVTSKTRRILALAAGVEDVSVNTVLESLEKTIEFLGEMNKKVTVIKQPIINKQ